MGIFCPAETPEGQSVGIVKNLSALTTISGHSESVVIERYIEPYLIKLDLNNSNVLYNKTKVILNGRWVGCYKTPIELYNDLKFKKSTGIMNIYTSIIFNYKMNLNIHI